MSAARILLALSHSLRRDRETGLWVAYLRRPRQRVLVYEGRTRREATDRMLNGLARLAVGTPERLTAPLASLVDPQSPQVLQ